MPDDIVTLDPARTALLVMDYTARESSPASTTPRSCSRGWSR